MWSELSCVFLANGVGGRLGLMFEVSWNYGHLTLASILGGVVHRDHSNLFRSSEVYL